LRPPDLQRRSVPPAGFEPAAHVLGIRPGRVADPVRRPKLVVTQGVCVTSSWGWLWVLVRALPTGCPLAGEPGDVQTARQRRAGLTRGMSIGPASPMATVSRRLFSRFPVGRPSQRKSAQVLVDVDGAGVVLGNQLLNAVDQVVPGRIASCRSYGALLQPGSETIALRSLAACEDSSEGNQQAPIERPLGDCGHWERCQVSRAGPRRSPRRWSTSAILDLVRTPTARPGPAR
jgi:hypothetical protein